MENLLSDRLVDALADYKEAQQMLNNAKRVVEQIAFQDIPPVLLDAYVKGVIRFNFPLPPNFKSRARVILAGEGMK